VLQCFSQTNASGAPASRSETTCSIDIQIRGGRSGRPGGGFREDAGGADGIGGITFNLNASAAGILTERNILNWFVSVLNRLERRSS
jgi:hypothetical protein